MCHSVDQTDRFNTSRKQGSSTPQKTLHGPAYKLVSALHPRIVQNIVYLDFILILLPIFVRKKPSKRWAKNTDYSKFSTKYISTHKTIAVYSLQYLFSYFNIFRPVLYLYWTKYSDIFTSEKMKK